MKEIIAFKPEHLKTMKPEIASPGGMFYQLDDYAKICATNGLAYSAVVDGKIIASAGMMLLWSGVGDAWVFSTSLVNKHPVFFHKAVVKMLSEIEVGYNLHRIQAVVKADNFTGHRWIRRLGFRLEGLMEKYGPDKQDFWRYARVKCQV